MLVDRLFGVTEAVHLAVELAAQLGDPVHQALVRVLDRGQVLGAGGQLVEGAGAKGHVERVRLAAVHVDGDQVPGQVLAGQGQPFLRAGQVRFGCGQPVSQFRRSGLAAGEQAGKVGFAGGSRIGPGLGGIEVGATGRNLIRSLLDPVAGSRLLLLERGSRSRP